MKFLKSVTIKKIYQKNNKHDKNEKRLHSFNSVFNLPESWITWDCATRWLASVSLEFRWIPTRVMLMTPPSTRRATQRNPHQWTCKSPYWLLGNTDSWYLLDWKFPLVYSQGRLIQCIYISHTFTYIQYKFTHPICHMWISCENSKQVNRFKFCWEECVMTFLWKFLRYVLKNISYYT